MADQDSLEFQIIVNKDGVVSVREFNQEVAKTPPVVNDANDSINKHNSLLDKLKSGIKESRSELRLQNFAMRELSHAFGVAALAMTVLDDTSSNSSEEMKKFTSSAKDGLVAFQGLSFALMAVPGGQVIAAFAGIATAALKLGQDFKTSYEEGVQKFIQGLKDISQPGTTYENALERGKVKLKSLTDEQGKYQDLLNKLSSAGVAGGTAINVLIESEMAEYLTLTKSGQERLRQIDVYEALVKGLQKAADGEKALREVMLAGETVYEARTKGILEEIEAQEKELKANQQAATDPLVIKAIQEKINNLEKYKKSLTDVVKGNYDLNISFTKLADGSLGFERFGASIERTLGLANATIKKFKADMHQQLGGDNDTKMTLSIEANVSKMEESLLTEREMIDKWEESILTSVYSTENQKTRATEVAAQKRQQLNLKEAQGYLQSMSSAIRTIGQLFSARYQNQINDIDKQKKATDDQYDAEITAAEGNADLQKQLRAQKAAADLNYENQLRAAKKSAWEVEHEASLLQAIANTAEAITKVFAQTGIFGFITSGIVAASAAAQVAIIAGQSAPAFAQGTGPEGFIVPSGFDNDNYPVMVSSREKVIVQTPEQQTQPSGGHSGVTIVINGITDVAGVKRVIQQGLRESGLTVDKWLVNNRSKIALAS